MREWGPEWVLALHRRTHYRSSPPDPIAPIGMVTVSGSNWWKALHPCARLCLSLPIEFLQAARRSCCHPQWQMSILMGHSGKPAEAGPIQKPKAILILMSSCWLEASHRVFAGPVGQPFGSPVSMWVCVEQGSSRMQGALPTGSRSFLWDGQGKLRNTQET